MKSMNPDWLLKHFEQVTEAPDAVSRLRRFVLDLAVRGKLVPQDPDEESAAELLTRIETQKKKIPQRRSGPKKCLEPIRTHEVPFLLPDHWKWVRIGEIFDYDAGIKTEPKQLPDDAWLLELEDIEKDSGKITQRITAKDRSPKSTKSKFQTNDVLYGKLRPYLNKAVVADGPGVSTTEIVVLRCYGDSAPHYTCLALRRPDFVDYVTRLGQGTKMPRLRTEDAISALFPLAPLAEQHRIVAKVNELMALCDELEAAQAKRERRRGRLVAATLHGLNNGGDGSQSGPSIQNGGFAETAVPDFHDTARFFLNHLPRFTTKPEHIHQLRQTILNLAVRGKLVPQNPKDEPVSDLLKRIQSEKGRLIAQCKVKAEQVFTATGETAPPFEIPDTWQWVSVSEVAERRLGKMLDKAKNRGTPRRYLRNVNVRWFDFDLSDLLHMKFEDEELDEFSLRNGDVLMCEGGEPGRAAVWDERETDIYFQKAIHRVRLLGFISPIFFVLCLRHDAVSLRLRQFFTGVGIRHFTGKGLASYSFPLPPLAEQQRIVARVDELMALCDELEARLTTIAKTRRQLLEATLREALAGGSSAN
jgi:type I restriction enzyme, S subunit